MHPHILALHIFLLAIVAALLVACDDGEPADQTASGQLMAASTSNLLSSLMMQWDARQDDSGRVKPGPLQFPRDILLHPESRIESISVQAMVESSEGHTSVQARFDRVSTGRSVDNSSQWSFPGVMRAEIATARSGGSTVNVSELIQRQALSLADATQTAMHVAGQHLQIVQTPASASKAVASAQSAADAIKPSCDTSYQLDVVPLASEPLTLDWRISQCPDGRQLAAINQWRSRAVPVRLDESGSGPVLDGWVWVSHTWGTLPTQGGAVVLDHLRLLLDSDGNKQQHLIASRSRRRSGRGPRTVLATLATSDDPFTSIKLNWEDQGEWLSPQTGFRYPDSYRVRSAEQGLDLLLTPVVVQSEMDNSQGVRWSGAVIASGSHDGFGFIEFQPVTAPSDSTVAAAGRLSGK